MKNRILEDLNTKVHMDLTYIIKSICISISVLIIALTMPFFVMADENESDDTDIVDAEKYLSNYRNNSLGSTETVEFEPIEPVKPEYHTDCNYYLYSGYYTSGENVTRRVWRHAFDLYNAGLIHGADPDYQCTFFAQMWFYDIYGFNSTGYGPSGNGGDIAYKVYYANTYHDEEGNLKHYFEISNEPKTMSILSITGMSHPLGHAMCIDEYDPQTDMITFSDGNVTNSGDVRIRVTMSYDEFKKTNPGYYVFATPTEELLNLISESE